MANVLKPRRFIVNTVDFDNCQRNNQVVLNEANRLYPDPLDSDEEMVFFLELVVASAAVEIRDADGSTILTGVTSFQSEHSPLRLEKGINIFGGTLTYAKGFFVKGRIPQ